MYALHLPPDADEARFRDAAKTALARGVNPADIVFVREDSGTLFDRLPEAAPDVPMTVPREFMALMQDAVCHRAEDRFALLYQVLWRLKHGEHELVARASDPAVGRLMHYTKAVQQDIHKMHAFVRFHKHQDEDGEVFFAWFEPMHFILTRAAPFFADRFAQMRWIIATPIGTAIWDGKILAYGPPREKPARLSDGVLDELWRCYYRTIFNPARVNTALTERHMPRRYWKNIPEAALIPDLVETSRTRLAEMDREADLAPRFADKARPRAVEGNAADGLEVLKAEASGCTACPLHRHATQTVFGEGPGTARIVFVGEQPGDSEDLAGKPFVGPAGAVFDRALAEAGIDRKTVYVTNAVKHFKFEPRGKRRIHSKPNAAEVKTCHGWLARELEMIQPKLIVALGATAALSLMGKPVAVTAMRGRELAWPGGRRGLMTVHPSYLLRLPDEVAKSAEYAKFVADLRLAAELA